MADFINTIDVLGDDAVADSIIDRTITEFKDDMVTNIGSGAFYSCAALKTIDLPNVTKINVNNAFTNCTSLVNVNLPKATIISAWNGYGSGSFQNCTSLERIHLPCATQLGDNAFSGCTSLIEITGLDNVNSLSSTVFRSCESLRTIYLPKITTLSVMNIFYGCKSFVTITSENLPALTALTGGNTFRDCTALTTVDLPKLTTFSSAHAFYGCSSLKSLILRSDTMCTLGVNNAFTNTLIAGDIGYIYVPRALVDSYKAATNWSVYAAQFRALEDYTVDGTLTGELDESKI